MILPALFPWMEQAHERAALVIERTHIASFPCIASDARIGQVAGFGPSFMFSADDVVYLVRRVCVIFM
jgi:hypothetical protein